MLLRVTVASILIVFSQSACIGIDRAREYYVEYKDVPYDWAIRRSSEIRNDPDDEDGVFVNFEFDPALKLVIPLGPVWVFLFGSPHWVVIFFDEPAGRCQQLRCDGVWLEFDDGTPAIPVPMEQEDTVGGGRDGWFGLRNNLGGDTPDHIAHIVSKDRIPLASGLSMWVRVTYSVNCNGRIRSHEVRKRVEFMSCWDFGLILP